MILQRIFRRILAWLFPSFPDSLSDWREPVNQSQDARIREKLRQLSQAQCAHIEGVGFPVPVGIPAPIWFWKRDQAGKAYRLYHVLPRH